MYKTIRGYKEAKEKRGDVAPSGELMKTARVNVMYSEIESKHCRDGCRNFYIWIKAEHGRFNFIRCQVGDKNYNFYISRI
jgi:hypothetical protein